MATITRIEAIEQIQEVLKAYENKIIDYIKKLEIKYIRGCYPNNLFLYICFYELHSKSRRL